MKGRITTALALVLASSALASEPITINRAGSQPATSGAAENFTGSVEVSGRFQGTGEATISGGTVAFAPGARTAWHIHPRGQALVVTSGVGLVQRWEGPIEEIRPGDTVWIPAGVKHWHGASPNEAMTHIAFSEAVDGSTVEWLELVDDEQYPE